MALSDPLLRSRETNATAAWLLVGVVALVGVESLLTDAVLWGGFALSVAAVTAVPAFSTRDWTVIVPWPLPFFAALAVLVRAFGAYQEIAGYVGIATLALVVVVELDAFTPVEMSRRFAVGFAVLTTMAFQGLWTIVQFYSDRWFGTALLRSQIELQWDYVAVTVVGLVMGVVFEWYLRQSDRYGPADRPSDSGGAS